MRIEDVIPLVNAVNGAWAAGTLGGDTGECPNCERLEGELARIVFAVQGVMGVGPRPLHEEELLEAFRRLSEVLQDLEATGD